MDDDALVVTYGDIMFDISKYDQYWKSGRSVKYN